MDKVNSKCDNLVPLQTEGNDPEVNNDNYMKHIGLSPKNSADVLTMTQGKGKITCLCSGNQISSDSVDKAKRKTWKSGVTKSFQMLRDYSSSKFE